MSEHEILKMFIVGTSPAYHRCARWRLYSNIRKKHLLAVSVRNACFQITFNVQSNLYSIKEFDDRACSNGLQSTHPRQRPSWWTEWCYRNVRRIQDSCYRRNKEHQTISFNKIWQSNWNFRVAPLTIDFVMQHDLPVRTLASIISSVLLLRSRSRYFRPQIAILLVHYKFN